jgi:hypothetical protein
MSPLADPFEKLAAVQEGWMKEEGETSLEFSVAENDR